MSSSSTPRSGTNRQKVLAALVSAGRPLSAYEVLDAVRPLGIPAPPTVYRALRQLVESGQVHRIESLKAYVACAADHDASESTLFLICEECGGVNEVIGSNVGDAVEEQSEKQRFVVEEAVLELRGRCQVCSPGASLAA